MAGGCGSTVTSFVHSSRESRFNCATLLLRGEGKYAYNLLLLVISPLLIKKCTHFVSDLDGSNNQDKIPRIKRTDICYRLKIRTRSQLVM